MGGRAGLLFLAVAVLWGVPYALIKVALDGGVAPLVVAFSRVAIGAGVLVALAAQRRAFAGLKAYMLPLVVVAVLDVAAPLTLLPLAERDVSSSLAGILVASTPLFVGAFGPLFGTEERPGARGWAGLALGFAGVVALFGIDVSGDLVAAALVLVAAAGYGVATLVVRRIRGVAPLGLSAAALGVAAVLLLPGAALSLPAGGDAGAWLAILALGLACTAAAFAAYYALIAAAGATRAALTTYVAPLFSVAVGALALGEPVGAGALLGLVLILAGSWLASRSAPLAVAVPGSLRRWTPRRSS
jgi:drug/metabolite transporter (DMT)-like permease